MADADGMAVLDLIVSYMKTQIVHAVASFSLPDHLAEGPQSAEALATACGANADALRRLLNAAAVLGVVGVEPDGRYASTPLLEALREDTPGSLRAFAMMMGSPGHWRPWGNLVEAVKTGEPQSASALGLAHFDYFKANPEERKIFLKAMQSTTEIVQTEVLRLLDFSHAGRVADIGGGNGALLCAVAKAHPGIEGVVFDLPQSVEQATDWIARNGLADRVRAQGGDFFQSAPAADLYLLKFILHDWDDASCVKILKTCRAAVRPGGKLAVIEMALGAPGEPGQGPLIDVNMLVLTGGRERTAEEYAALFVAGGFNLTRVIPTRSPFAIFEGVPV